MVKLRQDASSRLPFANSLCKESNRIRLKNIRETPFAFASQGSAEKFCQICILYRRGCTVDWEDSAGGHNAAQRLQQRLGCDARLRGVLLSLCCASGIL